MYVNPNKNDAWKDRLVRNLKLKIFQILSVKRNWVSIEEIFWKFWSIDHQSSIDHKRQWVLNTKVHSFDQSREIFDRSNNVNFKTLKIWKIYAKKNTWKEVFKTQCIWTWSRKVLKTWCLLDANIKTNQEVKIKDFKLLNTFFFNSQPKQKKKKNHLHVRSYAIKDGQISQHTINMY